MKSSPTFLLLWSWPCCLSLSHFAMKRKKIYLELQLRIFWQYCLSGNNEGKNLSWFFSASLQRQRLSVRFTCLYEYFPSPLSLTVNYYHIGCFKDNRSRAMPTLLGNWRHDSQAVQKCSLAAEKAGYSVFGVQYAGECWSGPQAHMTYKKYGASKRCAKGIGGTWAQDVYEIVSKWCVGDVTFIRKTLFQFLKCVWVSFLWTLLSLMLLISFVWALA